MGSKKSTIVFILIALICILGFDGFQAYQGGKEATISWVIYESAYKWPIIPLLFGILMGHFFYQMRDPKE